MVIASRWSWVTTMVVTPSRCCSWRSSTCIASRSLASSARQRLVEQEEPRRERERAGDRHPLALAAGQARDRAVGEARQADQVEQLGDALAPLRRADAADLQRVADVLADRQVREERQRLEHHAEVAPVRRHPGQVLPVEQDGAAGRLVEAGDHPQQRGLAAARRPEQADEEPVRDVQADRVDGGDRAVALGEVAELQPGHRQLAIISVQSWFSMSDFST